MYIRPCHVMAASCDGSAIWGADGCVTWVCVTWCLCHALFASCDGCARQIV